MARRVIRVERLIVVLGAAVLALGAVILWLVMRDGFGPSGPTPRERAEAQLRDHAGRDAAVVYEEAGRRSALCGYVRTGGRDTAFISRPNRVLLQTDPLRAEFDEMLRDLCPGFLTRPPTPQTTTGAPS